MSHASTGSEKNQIHIQLDQGESTKVLPTDELIQRRHYQSLRQQIQSHLESDLLTTEVSPRRGYPLGSGWTQFIDSSRGAGKSTFLSSVKRALEADSELKGKIVFFDVIDPSRIEHSEMPLLIISLGVENESSAMCSSKR